MTDIRIVNDILNGERDKYQIILDRYHHDLYRYVYNLVGDEQDTQAMVDMVFSKVYSDLLKFDAERQTLKAWIYDIASKYLVGELKTKYDKSQQGDISKPTPAITHEQAIDRIVAYMALHLRSKHLRVLSLHLFSNLTDKEIGTALKMSERSVGKVIRTQIEKIEKELTFQDETLA